MIRSGGRHIVIPAIMQVQTHAPRTAAAAAVAAPWYLTFDGGDYGVFSGVSVTPPFTVAFWVKRANTSGNHMVLTAAGFYYVFFSATDMYARHYYSHIVNQNSTAWVHYAINFVGDSENTRIYANGALITSAAPQNAYIIQQSYTRLGSAVDNSLGMVGNLACVGIAPKTLDIPTMYAVGAFHKPLDPATWTSLCLNMTEGTGTTLDDANGNDCTFGEGAAAPAWGGYMHDAGIAGWSDT